MPNSGSHDAVPVIRSTDPAHYGDYLYGAAALLQSMEKSFLDAAAEEVPKGHGGEAAVSSDGSSADGSDDEIVCIHVHSSRAKLDEYLDAVIRFGMFGDRSALTVMVHLSDVVVRALAEQAARAGWFDDEEEF